MPSQAHWDHQMAWTFETILGDLEPSSAAASGYLTLEPQSPEKNPQEGYWGQSKVDLILLHWKSLYSVGYYKREKNKFSFEVSMEEFMHKVTNNNKRTADAWINYISFQAGTFYFYLLQRISVCKGLKRFSRLTLHNILINSAPMTPKKINIIFF